jgi:DNA invertase Pin-like site-specific DNA recombinase
MVYGYIRVSTYQQNTENQRFEITNFAAKNGIKINRWISETISSSHSLDKRKLGKLILKIKAGDMIIASELSRLGRNLFQIMSILNHCMNVGAKIWTIKDNYRLGADIQSKVLAFAFGLSAEIERNLISDRTREALCRVRAEGKKLGRPSGSKSKKLKLSKCAEDVHQMLKIGVSQSEIARRLHVHRMTVGSFLKMQI